MADAAFDDAYRAVLGPREFARLAAVIEESCGIMMPPSKRQLLEGRLRRRLLALGMEGFEDYCKLLFGGGRERELPYLIDAVTTNKTEFFRERPHFDYLSRTLLPSLRDAGQRRLRVWSAACATGEEPYTLAMVLAEHTAASGGDFEVLATDISTRCLEQARRGIYGEEQVEPVPAALRSRHLTRSRDRSRGLVRVAPELRGKVQFGRVNLMERSLAVEGPFDVIFCRNVLIYFDTARQEELIRRLATLLPAGGHLFVGHSEALPVLDATLKRAAPAVYRKGG